MTSVAFEPIGVVRSPYGEKVEAPRQPAAGGAAGTIELFPGRGFEHAVSDLDAWTHVWVIFVFDRVTGWRPKVQPPRSARRRGVFATRSPHRPNPIGLSVVRLERVAGLVLHVHGLDVLDGSPVLDVKPYVAWADAVPDAGPGWLGAPADPTPTWDVAWSDEARAQATWLDARGVPIEGAVARALALGPEPHPYRRIRRDGDGWLLAWKEWRARFAVEGRTIRVVALVSGFRARAEMPPLHRAFVDVFG